MRVFTSSPLDTLQMQIVLSQDPDAKLFPLGVNTILETLSEWPMKVYISSPLDTFHKEIVLS